MRALVVVGVLLASCAPAAPPPAPAPRLSERGYPGVLHAPSSYPGDFLDEQKVSATYGDKSVSFEAVVQKQGDEMIILGRTPFGSRAFLLKQKGTEVSFEAYVDREMPFPPRYMLLDVHRALLAGIAAPGAALSDGMHTLAREEELVTERWEGGRLRERRFRRASGEPAGEIVIVYDGGMGADRAPPRRLSFSNGWFGYRLEITTSSHQRL
jgi:hypothetical protein